MLFGKPALAIAREGAGRAAAERAHPAVNLLCRHATPDLVSRSSVSWSLIVEIHPDGALDHALGEWQPGSSGGAMATAPPLAGA